MDPQLSVHHRLGYRESGLVLGQYFAFRRYRFEKFERVSNTQNGHLLINTLT